MKASSDSLTYQAAEPAPGDAEELGSWELVVDPRSEIVNPDPARNLELAQTLTRPLHLSV